MGTTLPSLNKKIVHLFVELIRGDGYFYLVSTKTQNQIGQSIMVYKINRAPMEWWIAEIESQIKEHGKNCNDWI